MVAERDIRRERALIEQYQLTGSQATLNELVEQHKGLVAYAVRPFLGRGVERDDLWQIANLGLCLAIQRFDTTRGTAFSTFAVYTMSGEIKRHFRDKKPTVKPPRSLGELSWKIRQLERTEEHKLTTEELSRRLGKNVNEIAEAQEANKRMHVHSLEEPLNVHGTRGARLQDSTEPLDDAVSRTVDLDRLLGTLPKEDREIMRLRFLEDLPQARVAALTGVDPRRISRIISTSCQKMRIAATPPDDLPQKTSPALIPQNSQRSLKPKLQLVLDHLLLLGGEVTLGSEHPLAQMAKELGITPTALFQRLIQLEKAGRITQKKTLTCAENAHAHCPTACKETLNWLRAQNASAIELAQHTASKSATELGISKPAAIERLNRLEAMGLIKKECYILVIVPEGTETTASQPPSLTLVAA